MNIAFVANGQKCHFFNLIGQSITKKKEGVNVFWICIAQFQYDYLLSTGHDKERILLLNWNIRKREEGGPIGEYKLNELLFSDRVLKNHFYEGLNYLNKMQSIFYNFVRKHKLQYIFGEITWAHEILMSRICRDKFAKECYYLHPQSIRIPNGRFTLMDTEFQDTIHYEAEYAHNEDILKGVTIPIKPIVPQRVADVAKDVEYSLTTKYKIKKLLNFFIFSHFEKYPNDSLQSLKSSLFKRIKRFLDTEFNKFFYTKILDKVSLNDLVGKKFFFVTLHMQPEASVDVVGRYYDDQFLLIRDVWRILPNDYYLVVKEHTNAIGNRGSSFFRKCLALNNTLIIHEQVSSHEIIKMSETIFTNSGTVAFEGALMNKDVFLFSNIFFDKLKYCHRISLEDLKYNSSYFEMLNSCLERDKGKMDPNEFSEYILRSSFEGIIDPHTNSRLFTDRANIETIANSFVFFLSQDKS